MPGRDKRGGHGALIEAVAGVIDEVVVKTFGAIVNPGSVSLATRPEQPPNVFNSGNETNNVNEMVFLSVQT
jgi:hypothetical protein